MTQPFNILLVAHAGRLQYESLLLVASLRAMSPDFPGRVIVAEPRGGAWSGGGISSPIRAELDRMGAEVTGFTPWVFGDSYPQGNKIEALATLPPDEPFLFLDSDTLITGDLSALPVTRPTASMRREATWPVPDLYWPGYAGVWRSLYQMFGLDFDSSLDLSQPDEHWERYLYFNAGWFCGADPVAFGDRFLRYARAIRDTPPEALVIQPLTPWLDQIALPLVIHALGGGRPGPGMGRLDDGLTCHYRLMPLLYARESDRVVQVLEQVAAPNRLKKLLKQHEPFKRMIYQGRGMKARALFDQADLPRREQKIRNVLKRNGFWMR